MKKYLLGTVAFLALGSAAVAADLPARTYTKAPAYAAPIYNWTGFYIGGHVGASFGNNRNFAGPGVFNTNNDDARFLGGGQIGADYQFSPNWLVGIEGQISATDLDRTFVSVPAAFIVRQRTDWLGSVTGRLGYTWGPGLLYAKGGVGFRDNNNLGVFTAAGAPVAFTGNNEQTGYTVGGGLEYMFAPSWSAKVEYQYYNFDNRNIVTAAAPFPAPGVRFNDDIHTVKVGVNYRFNWGGPVVAKY